MFSKVLALSLGALALLSATKAVSLQTPMFSCSVDDLGPSIERTSFQEPLSGQYTIFNPTWGSSALQVKYVWGWLALRFRYSQPANDTKWFIEPRGDEYPDEYTITNVEFEKPVCVFERFKLALGAPDDPTSYWTILPNGKGGFTISVPDSDGESVWSVFLMGHDIDSPVLLQQKQRNPEESWVIVPVEE
ncbi:hypothetical protein K438DRAFT_1998838 [Mycena galopus ATCC 62051]|nr:hypothetical protein K438DRAFT_1998838 [Mycena galopus ATCC 62051]